MNPLTFRARCRRADRLVRRLDAAACGITLPCVDTDEADMDSRRCSSGNRRTTRTGPWPHKRRTAGLALALFAFSLSGCQSAMPSPNSASNGTGTLVSNEFPLRFNQHNFEAHCYNTIGCSVFYAGVYQIKKAPQEISPAPRTADYRRNWGGALHVGIANFPEPAKVNWRSSDGQVHQAEVDIGAIFKDRIILHNVPDMDIPEGAKIISPSILLEVDDRTIRVYMKAHIPTRQLQAPGNRYSDFRDDLILAWSNTY